MSRRISVTLTDEQHSVLLRESRRRGVTVMELVRRALDREYREVSIADALRALDDSFGSWSDRALDGAAYVENLRRGIRLSDR